MKKKCANGGIVKKPLTMQEQLAQVRGNVRPGYAAGGIPGIDLPVSLSNPFPSRAPLGSGLGATAIQAGGQAINAPGSTPQSLGTIGRPDYSTGPRQGGFVNEDGTPRQVQETGSPADARGPLSGQIDMGKAMANLSNTERYKLGGSGTAAEASAINQRNDITQSLNAQLTPTQQVQVNRPPRAGIGAVPSVQSLAAPASMPEPNQEPFRRQSRKQGFASGGRVFRDGNTFSDRPLMPEPGNHPQRIAIAQRPMPRPAAAPQQVRIPLPPPEYPQERARPAPVDSGAPVGTYPGVTGIADAIRNRKVKNAEAADYSDGGRVWMPDDGTAAPQYGARGDGTKKGKGYLGELRTPQGDVMTENSIGVPVFGKETNIPSIVPTLVKQEVDHLTNGGRPTSGIAKKATEHAERRIKSGQSPFANDSYLNYAAGGMVKFAGPGGPRDDKIPVKVAGAEINVSNGENAVILPAKTAANPAALQAINGIIQATNDGRQPMNGGGSFATGGYPYDGKRPPTAQELYGEVAPAGIAAALTPATWRAAKVVAPPGSVGGGMSSSGTDPRDIPEGGTITNLAPAFQQVTAPIRAAAGGIGQVFADSAQAQREGVSYQDIKQRKPIEQATPYSNEGRPSAMDRYALTPVYGNAPQGIASGMAQDSGARTKDGMTTTQMGRGFDPTKLTMADGYGMASNAAGKTISAGPSEYVGADGKPTSRWTDTAAYKDAIARNERDKIRLAEMQAVRLGANPQQALQASQGIAQAAQQSGLAAQQAGQAQQVQQFAIDKAAREQSLIDAWDKAGTPEQKQAIAGQLKIVRGQQEKEGQFDATKGGQAVDPATGQIIDLPPVIFNKSTGQPVQQAQAAQQAVPPADKRTVGQTYQTPKGPMIWRGNGWEAAR